MCGIFGFVGSSCDKARFEDSCNEMYSRGPNDAGFFYRQGVSLGHRRLSIIDLSSNGHQPMQSHDDRFTIIFNGEIFNYIELKKELAEKYPFQTNSDTEVLLAGYCVWGAEILAKLVGQFTFAIWDEQKKELFFARDHFGIKPLFYAFHEGGLVFASEIKALIRFGVPALADDLTIFQYLAYGIYDHGERTFFKGILSFPRAHYGMYAGGALTLTPYWNLLDAVSQEKAPSSLDEAIDNFNNLLHNAVSLQLRSDVPIGINLSSGLDSSTLFHSSEKLLSGEVHAFSSCLVDEYYNECKFIQPWLANYPRVTWHTGTLAPKDVWSLMPELSRVQDQPYGGMNTMQYFNLYRQNPGTPVTVLLEGQGMDEILAGYVQYQAQNREAFLSSFLSPSMKCSYISSDFAQKQGVDAGHLGGVPEFATNLQKVQFIDLWYRKLPRTLRFNDHISMAFSKELRVPFLDHRLVAYAFSLPDHYKINGDVQKYLLRKAIERDVPHADRPKNFIEFSAFQTAWFRKYFVADIQDFLDRVSRKNRPYWDMEKMRSAVNSFLKGEGENSFFLWQIINLELWLEQYID